MNKFKREIIRAQMKFALNYPALMSDNIRKNIFRNWNRCQRDFALNDYSKTATAPHPDAPLQLLDLSCTCGFGENVHPDVIYIPDGFGVNSWKYLMTCTPLPQGVEYFENPEFLVSMDGVNWSVPRGGASPLIKAPDEWIGYNSDPSLYFENGTLTLFYRDYLASSGCAFVRILMMSTKDGIAWTEPRVILSYKRGVKDGAVIMSPSVLKLNGVYYMWYVWRNHNGRHQVWRMESKDLLNWHTPSLIKIEGLPAEEEPWHPDVAQAPDGSLVMALCTFPKGHYRNMRIMLCTCLDMGLTWNFNDSFIERGSYNFGSKSLYRPSLVLNAPVPLLYYSGQDELNHWRMVCREI